MKFNGPGAHRRSTKPRAGSALFLSLVLFPALFLRIDPAQADKVFHYTANTRAKAAKQGRVVASGIEWRCNGSKCTVSGPWPVPGVIACKALAQQVGAIKSYGHDAAVLNASQLGQCNGSVAAATKAVAATKGGVDEVPIPGQTPQVSPARKQASVGGIVHRAPVESLPDKPTATLANRHTGATLHTSMETWRCEGERCTIAFNEQMSPRHTVSACSRLAQAGGRVVFFTDGRKPLDSGKLARCNSPVVHEVEVIACSGEDDLRRNSQLKMGMQIEGRDFTEANYKQLFTEIPAHTCKTAKIGRLLVPSFPLSDLRSVYLDFHSYDSGPYDTADNWDLVQFSLTATVTDPGGRRFMERVVERSGNPIHRFENVERWRIDVDR